MRLKLLGLVVTLVACAPAIEEIDGQGGASQGYGGYASETGGASSVPSAPETGGERSGVSWAPITGGAAVATGGSSASSSTVTGGSTSTGGQSATGGASATGGSSFAASAGGSSSTGGVTSTGGASNAQTTVTQECFYSLQSPELGACSVHSNGKYYCNENDMCDASGLKTGFLLDCDHDGTLDTPSGTATDCGYCGNVCGAGQKCNRVPNDWPICS